MPTISLADTPSHLFSFEMLSAVLVGVALICLAIFLRGRSHEL
jgi:hypothetical protein